MRPTEPSRKSGDRPMALTRLTILIADAIVELRLNVPPLLRGSILAKRRIARLSS
jgi:hypothetical protein